MNVIEKYDSYFIYTGVLVNAFIAYQFLDIWLYPDWDQAGQIKTMGVLMIFEFIMIHSGLIMGASSKKASLFIAFPFYGIFVYLFSKAIDDWHIIVFTYLFAVFNRMRFALADIPKHIKKRNMFTSGFAGVFYLIMMILLVNTKDVIPDFGLNSSYLAASGYLEQEFPIGETLKKTPKVVICLGFIYYSALSIVEFCLVLNRERFFKPVN